MELKTLFKKLDQRHDKKYWVKKLDRIFSDFIRLRDCHGPSGVGFCITCRKPITFKDSDCSHYIGRRHLGLRWDEMNTAAACRYCNRFESGMQHEFHEALVKKYGADKIALMLTRKHARGPDAWAMEMLYKEYVEKVKALKGFQ